MVTKARGLTLLDILPACGLVVMLGCLLGCAGPSASFIDDGKPRDPLGAVRNADFSARFAAAEGQSQEGGQSGQSTKPLLFPGADAAPASRRDRDPAMAPASLQQAAFVKGDDLQDAATRDGVEINFDGADVQ